MDENRVTGTEFIAVNKEKLNYLIVWFPCSQCPFTAKCNGFSCEGKMKKWLTSVD